EKDARADAGAKRDHRPRNAATDLREESDCTGPLDLAPTDRKTDHQSGEGLGNRPRYAQAQSDCRCDAHRPASGMVHRRQQVQIKEPKLSLRWLESARTSESRSGAWTGALRVEMSCPGAKSKEVKLWLLT